MVSEKKGIFSGRSKIGKKKSKHESMSSGVSVRLAIMKMCSGSLTSNTHNQRVVYICFHFLIPRFMICDYDHSQTAPVFLRRALTY